MSIYGYEGHGEHGIGDPFDAERIMELRRIQDRADGYGFMASRAAGELERIAEILSDHCDGDGAACPCDLCEAMRTTEYAEVLPDPTEDV